MLRAARRLLAGVAGAEGLLVAGLIGTPLVRLLALRRLREQMPESFDGRLALAAIEAAILEDGY